jgi:hypothetical protein
LVYIYTVELPDFKSILVDSSRLVADLVVEQVGRDPARMEELYRLAIQAKGQLAMRAARAFDLTDEKYPGMASPHIREMIYGLTKINHLSVVRCFLRTIVRYPLPQDEDDLGVLYETALNFMIDTKKPVALRYYGVLIAVNIVYQIPDLRFELFAIFDEIQREPGKGLINRVIKSKKELINKFGAE